MSVNDRYFVYSFVAKGESRKAVGAEPEANASLDYDRHVDMSSAVVPSKNQALQPPAATGPRMRAYFYNSDWAFD